ncbi:MAG: ATP-binding protein [Sulfuricella sp.]
MRRFAGSLYAHLTLVLLIALGASFATMYFLFLSHLEDTRNSNFVRSVVAQVRLVEELLRARPASEFPAIAGIRVARTAPSPTSNPDSKTTRRLPFLKGRLSEELHRNVEVVASTNPVTGLWINLSTPADHTQWMFIPTHKSHSRLGDPLVRVLLVGFAVFFAGSMALLWRIQRPLKLLSKALEMVGQPRGLATLPVTGAREIRVLAERYNDMVERLHRYEEDRAMMLAGVAHDLRSPITRLRLLVELTQGPRIGEMLLNIDDIERITEQFLDYARGNNDERIEQRDLDFFIEEVCAPYAEQGVSIVGEKSNVVLSIRSNSLRRALMNLIENAMEYGRPPITVRISREDKHVTIAVEDSGNGIDPDQISRALRPFSRLDSSRGGKGHCGLGLVIASKIAEEHGGELELRNLDGRGFVAAIRLPITVDLARQS